MDAKKRKEEVFKLLQKNNKPISASNIAQHFSVSRQIIVGDIALLRAFGHDITATHSGYILNKKAEENSDLDTYILACKHDKVGLETELFIIVDNGGELVNVLVDHPFYGSLSQELNICNRYDATAFIKKVALSGGNLLSSLTAGEHLHTIRCAQPDAYRRIMAALKEKGILNII